MSMAKFTGIVAWFVGIGFLFFAISGCQDGFFRARLFDLERFVGPQAGPALSELGGLLHGLFLLARAMVGVAFAILGTLLCQHEEV